MELGMLRGDRARAMLRLLLAGTSLIVLIGPSRAADLPVARSLPPAVAASWAGFYLGVHGGYGWSRDDYSDTRELVNGNQTLNGFQGHGGIYGAHAGYNWQFGRAVTGTEIDFSLTDIKGSNSISQTAVLGGQVQSQGITRSEHIRYIGSARARVGWLPSDKWLLYGTAGLAWQRIDVSEANPSSIPGSVFTESSRTAANKFGWVAGLGAETTLGSANWVGRLEYLHYGFDSIVGDQTFISPGASFGSRAGSQTVDVLRAGVSYKFAEPATLAPARYAKAPVTTPSAAWAGFYLGAHGGYAWGHDPYTAPMAVFLGGTDVIRGNVGDSWVAGGHFGHNWQYDRVVAGLEADLSAIDLKGATNTGTFDALSLSYDEKVQYVGTVRGRLGWLPLDNILLYGTAGLAWERFNRTEIDTVSLPAGTRVLRDNTPSNQFGWVAGIGGEVMLGSVNWIGRLEYLHYDFGHVLPDFVEGVNADIASTSTGRQTIDLIRAGVSYKFGPNAPLTALAMAGTGAPPPPQNWAGFYLGGHAGYGWKMNDLSSTDLGTGFRPIDGIKSQGWLAGGHAGYVWQYANAIGGVEIDGTATSLEGRIPPGTVLNLTSSLADHAKYLGTVRVRVGWTPVTNWLLYGTGGMAWERADRTRNRVTDVGGGFNASITTDQRDQLGWVAGAGAETFIGSSNWIARLEYLHYDFGTVDAIESVSSTVPGAVQGAQRGGHETIETVRAGLSYKFTP